jgi:hypothetical protein
VLANKAYGTKGWTLSLTPQQGEEGVSCEIVASSLSSISQGEQSAPRSNERGKTSRAIWLREGGGVGLSTAASVTTRLNGRTQTKSYYLVTLLVGMTGTSACCSNRRSMAIPAGCYRMNSELICNHIGILFQVPICNSIVFHLSQSTASDYIRGVFWRTN